MDIKENHYLNCQKIKLESKALKKITGFSLSDCREFYARVFGYQHFHELQCLAKNYIGPKFATEDEMSAMTEPLVVCFDIETKPFSDDFRKASSNKERYKHVPEMRVACSYDTKSEKYKFYEPHQIKKLIRLLVKSDKIISFNGKRFDLLLLEKHHQFNPSELISSHIDLCEVLNYKLSLDKAALQNLNERKHTQGRDMSKHSLKELKEACQSDVSQTFRLYLLLEEGSLIIPKSYRKEEEFDLEPGCSRILGYDENNKVITESCSEEWIVSRNETGMSPGEYMLSLMNPDFVAAQEEGWREKFINRLNLNSELEYNN